MRFPGASLLRRLLSDYGMVLVLLLLIAVISLLTLKPQSLTGREAGAATAVEILAAFGQSAVVAIAVPAGADDRQFLAAVQAGVQGGGGQVVGAIAGAPAQARQMLQQAAAAGHSINALAVTGKSQQWPVLADVLKDGGVRCFVPQTRLWPDFLKSGNLLGVANQTAIYAIIAVGMTMVIILREIDLSVGSIVALSSVTAAVFLRDVGGGASAGSGALALACLLAVLVAAAAGAVNGLLVTTARLPSFIATLAMMLIARGLAQRITSQESIGDTWLPPAFKTLGGGSPGGLPNPVWIMIVLYAVAHFVMSRTAFGRKLYAIGGNPEAARLCGIRLQAMKFAVFTISGGLAGLGGLLLSSRLNCGDPKYGDMYELEVIAAAVVGGTSLMGGEGRMLGTLIGAFIIAVIRNGMNLLGVESSGQSIVLGAVLAGAVLIDQLKRRWQSER
ncbi:MAG: ABC transporter permease [Planctomycetaceae bacterium]